MNESPSVRAETHADAGFVRGETRRQDAGEGRTGTVAQRPRPALWSLVALTHTLVFALAGLYVPWDPWAPFAVSCHLLATVHLTSAATAWVAKRPGGVAIHRWILRALAVVSLLHLFVMAIVVARGMVLLVEVYGDLGKGLAAAIAAAFCVEILFTLPLGCWAWALARRADEPRRSASATSDPRVLAIAGAVLLVSATAATLAPALRAGATPAASPLIGGEWTNGDASTTPDEAAVLARIVGQRPQGSRGLAAEERAVHTDATCASKLDTPGLATIFVAFSTAPSKRKPNGSADDAGGRAEPRHLCVQAPAEDVFDALDVALGEAAATRPMRIDVVEAVRELPDVDPLVRPFILRPGLDGLCIGERCTTPWQLAARRAFISLTPVPTIPDLRMGVDLARTTAGASGPAVAFSTRAYLVQRDGEVVQTSRLALAPSPMRAVTTTPNETREAALETAIELATTHIVRAQQGDGKFRYTIDPFRARRNDHGVNLPRQAGTTLVLCELADDEHLAVMRRSLDYMASEAIHSGEVTALVRGQAAAKASAAHAERPNRDGRDGGDGRDSGDSGDGGDGGDGGEDGDGDKNGDAEADAPGRVLPTAADLGSTALPAIAFLACRDRTGPKHDAEIVRMVRFLLAMQLPDGTFHPKWDLHAAAPQPGPHPLFAEGQAVYALGLAEQLARERPELGLDAAALHEAVERSLDHFSRDYWPRVLRDFFFVEENWHCLAARALLESHRHDEYERFCLDYVSFKRRLLLHAHDRVHEDFVGGYGFGNLVPPQSTPTAGLGEALAAGIAIARARGEDTAAMEADLRLVHDFLLRQQIRRARCFGCRNLAELDGGFSESMVSPGLRIDFTQHALAALAHGRDVLDPQLWESEDE